MSSRSPASRLLRQCLLHARPELLRSVGWAVLRQLAFLSLPWLLGRAVDSGVRGGDTTATAAWAAVFLLAATAEYAGMRGWQLWSNLAEARTGARLRTRMLGAVLAVDTETLRGDADRTGDLAVRAGRDVDAVLAWVHGLTAWVVIGLTALLLCPALFGLDPLLLLVAAATVPVLLVVNRFFPPLFARRAEKLSRAHGRRGSTVEELLAGLLSLRGVGADRLMVERHHRHSARITHRTLGLAGVGAAWEAVAFVVPLLAVVGGLLAGGAAAADGRITVGQLTAFALWMGTVSVAVNVAVDRLGDRAEALVAAARISEVLELPAPGGDPAAALAPRGILEIAGLVVRRERRAPVGPLDLTAGPGEWIVLTGPTGGGKSTLLRAVARLVPADGTVRFAGRDLADVHPDRLYETLGYVPERPLLLDGTVTDNLLLGGDRPAAELAKATAVAGLDIALAGVVGGTAAPVGEHGGALSGGQRQLVALARTLLRGSPVLLLDDFTSALDAATEAEVLARLRAATADRVVLIASHSPAVRALADREIVVGIAAPDDESDPRDPLETVRHV
ncbi:ATP-binding cassette domain-containing protein [Streptomyces sp. NPDC050504]|uniref:ATP-binding cassette domain-containing protein n=1 Tax=Streptomyces sp. NPDC050504 TaxID=3365618 RepID=UPI0037B4FDE9